MSTVATPRFQDMVSDQFWKRAVVDTFCRSHTLTDDDFALCVKGMMDIGIGVPANSPERAAVPPAGLRSNSTLGICHIRHQYPLSLKDTEG